MVGGGNYEGHYQSQVGMSSLVHGQDYLRKLLAAVEKRAEVVEFNAAQLEAWSWKQDQRITELSGELQILKANHVTRANCGPSSTYVYYIYIFILGLLIALARWGVLSLILNSFSQHLFLMSFIHTQF